MESYAFCRSMFIINLAEMFTTITSDNLLSKDGVIMDVSSWDKSRLFLSNKGTNNLTQPICKQLENNFVQDIATSNRYVIYNTGH